MTMFKGKLFRELSPSFAELVYHVTGKEPVGDRAIQAVVCIVVMDGTPGEEDGCGVSYVCEGNGKALKLAYRRMASSALRAHPAFGDAMVTGMQDAVMAEMKAVIRRLCEEQGVNFDEKWEEAEATHEVKYMLYSEERDRGTEHKALVARDPINAFFSLRYQMEKGK